MARSLAAEFARREMRGGLRGFRIFLACLTLGVAAIAGVGSLATAITEGLRGEGATLLGGDVELRLVYRPAGAAESDYLREHAKVTHAVQMRAMAYQNLTDGRRALVELKAVDKVYPLYGEALLDPAGPLEEALAFQDRQWGAVVDPVLLERLGLKVGETLKIGEVAYRIRAALVREPDRGANVFVLGPRVMVARASVAETGLIQEGSLAYHHYRLGLPPGADLTQWTEDLAATFPDATWRVRTRLNASPGVARFVSRMGLFLTLVGLSALVVGGVGVSNAVRGYLESRTETIAILKCLGATSKFIFRLYLFQIMALAALGVLLGVFLGAVLPLALGRVLADRLPVPTELEMFAGPLLLAAAYGMLTAFAFAVRALGRAGRVPPSALFRDLVAPSSLKPGWRHSLAGLATIVVLATLAVVTSGDRWFAGFFVGGVLASFAILRGVAWMVVALARKAPRPGSVTLRHAIGNLCRPGAATASLILSLGLGLTLLVAVALIEGNLSHELQEQLPERAPAFFFVDIQSAQMSAFKDTALAIKGVEDLETVPSVRGRITRINGVPAREAVIAPEARWTLRGDRSFTYARLAPPQDVVTSGEWWPPDYAGKPLISLDQEIARGFGVTPGDELTLNILGREITAEIANTRRIDWGNLSLNHVVIFAPGTLEAAPHTWMATVNAEGAAEEALFRAVTDRFTNITVIRIKEALAAARKILTEVGVAARATAAATLLAGVLVLAGAIAAGHRRKIYDAVVFKVLGATRRDIMGIYLLEYAMLGLVTALIAGLIGAGAAYAVVTQVWGLDWIFLPTTLAATLVMALAVTLTLGLAGTWAALREKAAPMLRVE